MNKFAVIGSPIEHSLSPMLHKAFAANTKQQLTYIKQLVTVDSLPQALAQFKAAGFRGLNVTQPLKCAVLDYVNQVDPSVEAVGAANMLSFVGDEICAYNTDGIGFMRDLLINQQIKLSDKRVLVVGAGGAARGIVALLLQQPLTLLHLANRTLSRAEQLIKNCSSAPVRLSCSDLTHIPPGFDLIINATSCSIMGDALNLSPTIIGQDACCYDLAYRSAAASFLTWARINGAQQIVDGWGMLVEQAAQAFYVWHQVRPDCHPFLSSPPSF